MISSLVLAVGFLPSYKTCGRAVVAASFGTELSLCGDGEQHLRWRSVSKVVGKQRCMTAKLSATNTLISEADKLHAGNDAVGLFEVKSKSTGRRMHVQMTFFGLHRCSKELIPQMWRLLGAFAELITTSRRSP